MSKGKQIWSDPVWSKVIASAILAGFAVTGTYLLHWWPAIGYALSRVSGFLVAKTPVWNWLLALMISIIVVVMAIAVLAYRAAKQELPNPLLSYTSDEFLGVEWRWHYGPRWRIEGIHSLCLRCGLQIFMADASAYDVFPRIVVYCDECGQKTREVDGNTHMVERRVIRLIQRNLRERSKAVSSGSNQ